MQFNPSISWESHRELTHSITASFFVLGSLNAFVRLRSDAQNAASPGRWKFYILFAVCVALGTLSKYNFGIFFASLLLAGICVKDFRPLVLNRKMGAAILLALALTAPHFVWVWEHRDLAFSSMYKFKMEETQPWLPTVLKGLVKWVTDVVAHVGPSLGILGLIFWKTLRKPHCAPPTAKILWRTLLWILGLVTASVILFKVTGFRDRWLQPLFVWFPVLFFALYYEHLTPLRAKIILFLGVIVGIVVLILAPGRMLLTERLKKSEILNTPYRLFAHDLRPSMQSADCIIALDYKIAGNLHLWFPDKSVTSPEFADLLPPTKGRTILVWDAASDKKTVDNFKKFAETRTGKTATGPVFHAQEILKYHHDKSMKLTAVVME
jgi:hypothetical protein